MDLEGSIKSYSPLYGWTRSVGLEKLWEKANPQPVALTSKTGSGLHKKNTRDEKPRRWSPHGISRERGTVEFI